MPYYIRKLPCKSNLLVDDKQIPENTSLYNPSVSGIYTYIRKTERTNSGEVNSILIHNRETDKLQNIDTPWNLMSKTVNLYRGLEDLRICSFNGKIWFAGTSTHISDNMNSELAIGYFNEELTKVEAVQMVDIGTRPVKNIVPFVKDNKLYLLDVFLKNIYELKIDEDNENKMYVEKYLTLRQVNKSENEKYSGSTSPIHLHGPIYGCIVHDIIYNDNSRLVSKLSYLHHWMEFDINTGLITFISTPFFIANWGIEFVSGINKMEDGNIELYLGINDKLPMRSITTLSNLRVGK